MVYDFQKILDFVRVAEPLLNHSSNGEVTGGLGARSALDTCGSPRLPIYRCLFVSAYFFERAPRRCHHIGRQHPRRGRGD